MTRNRLIRRLQEINVIEKGKFKARSGGELAFYCNVKRAFGYPDVLSALASQIGQRLPVQTTCIAASGYGGLPLGSVVASRFKLRLATVRNSIKDHGMEGCIDGYVPQRHDRVVIVDDVLTTGSSVMATAAALKEVGVEISQVLVVVRRGRVMLPIQYSFIFDIEELLI